MDYLKNLHGLQCAGGDLSECDGDRAICKSRGGRYLGQDWDACPVRKLMSSSRALYVLQLEREQSLNGGKLSGWPHTFAAWVPAVLGLIRDARDSRRTTEAKR